MDKFIAPFLLAFLITEFLTIAIIWLGKYLPFEGREESRHFHNKKTLRLGGIVMVIAFNLAVILDKNLVIVPELYAFMAVSFLIMVAGLWDDLKEIHWKFQLFFQFGISLLIFVAGIRIYYVSNPLTGGIISLDNEWGVLISVILIIFWITLVMNATNWLDGIDGLSGGIAFIASVTVFFLSLRPEVNQPPIAILAAILAGTILGFLIFNFNPSRILAGTSGAMFMGFSLAVLAIFSGTKIATAALVMFIPIMDLIWVVFERMRNGRSIFKPDKAHIHHKLLSLGWSQKKITVVFYAITISIAIIAMNTRFIGKSITLITAGIIMLLLLILLDRRLKQGGAISK